MFTNLFGSIFYNFEYHMSRGFRVDCEAENNAYMRCLVIPVVDINA